MNTGLPGYCNKGIPLPRVLCHSLTEVPGKGMGILQNLQKFRVRVRKCYRTHRSSGYCGTGVQNSQKFRAGIKMLYPYPGYLWHERTELMYVPCRTQPFSTIIETHFYMVRVTLRSRLLLLLLLLFAHQLIATQRSPWSQDRLQ